MNRIAYLKRRFAQNKSIAEMAEWKTLGVCLLACAFLVLLTWARVWARDPDDKALCSVEIKQGRSTYVMWGTSERRGDGWVCKVKRA